MIWHALTLLIDFIIFIIFYFILNFSPKFFLGHASVSIQLPHFLICTLSHHFQTRSPPSLLDLGFSYILLNTITCLVSLCMILVSPSLESSVGLVTIGRSTR